MVRRKLRTLIDVGVFDDPPGAGTVDVAAGQAVAQRVEEAAIVLLANRNQQLPLNATALHAIAVIGGHADVAVATGGGSSQVATRQDSPVVEPCAAELELYNGACRTWLRSSPLAAIRAHAPGATISYQDGHDPEAAAASAAKADVAIVFATTWMHESKDLADLALPDAQDELIGRVAEANPHTIVVLETGTAVTMPWLANVSAVVEAWYPGIRGADAIARVLFGDVDPSGRLPITFPRAEADLPSPAAPVDADVNYAERLLIGYRWFDARAKEPLFPFGFGLSYTHVATSNLTAQLARTGGHVELDVANIGARPGAEVVPVYLQFPAAADVPPRRLVAWQKVALAHGETRHVSIDVPARELRVWTEHGWTVLPGDYAIIVGTLHVTTRI
jgi:beta-glucosidase